MRIGISIRLVMLQALLASAFLLAGNLLQNAVADQPDKARLYFITQEGCPPCRQVEPVIEALKREGYPVTTVNFYANQQWAQQVGVDRTPTVLMVANGSAKQRHSGLIDGVTLKQWFAAVGVHSGSAFGSGNAPLEGGTKMVLPANNGAVPVAQAMANFNSPTMLQGTTRPNDEFEQLAMQATVRLKVEDPAGTSYATGTVIHSFRGESLVITCGHVFRDSGGKGKISAEHGFDSGILKTVPGELIFYDAKARDIGLVAIKTRKPITPVPIANRDASINRGRDVFSIGCDHGDAPTIRHTRIKNSASYDGAIKYDIFGRPVDGRSGGGLFTKQGELIGVCNAAAVEVDEGIYTALDTIYWQFAQSNLEHLFEKPRIAATPPSRMPVPGASSRTFARGSAKSGFAEQGAPAGQLAVLPVRQTGRTDVTWGNQPGGASFEASGDREVVILIRSKSNPAQSNQVTIDDPTPELLNYLDAMNAGHLRQIEVARLRKKNEARANGNRSSFR